MGKTSKPAPCALGVDRAAGVLAKQGKALRAEVPGVAAHGPDAIHDMRVASRRLRAALGETAPYLSAKAAAAAMESARGVTRGLGVARELDVTMALLESLRGELTGGGLAALDHVLAAAAALRSGESANVEKAAAAADAFRDLDTAKAKNGAPCILERARRRLWKRYRTLTKRYDAWLASQREIDLHEVRIAFKKLRYGCEIYAPLYGRRMAGFIRTLKDAQEHLGAWNDCRVAIAYAAEARGGAEGETAEGYEAVLGALTKRRDALFHQWGDDGGRFFAPRRRAAAAALFASPAGPCCTAEAGSFTHLTRAP